MRPAGSTRPRRRGHRERRAFPALGPSRDDGQARLTLELYVVRHGETEWSLSGRHTGSTDLPLTAHGEQNAVALKPRLAAIPFDAVYASPLRRALQTAELAGFSRPIVTPLLRELDYGDYEGKTSAEIHQS
ncbi:MAG TPA: histidine phosphatase family protein, partial [Solirubrobacteraceae bacterium]|nr:histidine phosphatase family protein [Solirubrobacteraceae bacterium]